jgi:hypothetical protein
VSTASSYPDDITNPRHELEQYVDAICAHLPGWACRTLIWLREPSRWPVRIVAAVLLVLGGLLAFLPVLGLWMLPLGLIVIAGSAVPAATAASRLSLG